MTAENPGASSDYSFNPWMQNQPPIVRLKKPAYNSMDDEVRAKDLIDTLTMPTDAISQIRPRVGNPPFPPRFGYEQRQPTILDVMTIGSTSLIQDTATKQDSGMQPGSGPGLSNW